MQGGIVRNSKIHSIPEYMSHPRRLSSQLKKCLSHTSPGIKIVKILESTPFKHLTKIGVIHHGNTLMEAI
jgi:hypothetical protein